MLVFELGSLELLKSGFLSLSFSKETQKIDEKIRKREVDALARKFKKSFTVYEIENIYDHAQLYMKNEKTFEFLQFQKIFPKLLVEISSKKLIIK